MGRKYGVSEGERRIYFRSTAVSLNRHEGPPKLNTSSRDQARSDIVKAHASPVNDASKK